MSQLKPSDFSLLLEVFREGLLCGLISREEIIAWADEIIKAEDEPDYFFIEIALSGNVNNLLAILDKCVVIPGSIITSRAIIGIVYQKLANQTIDAKRALDVLNKINSNDIITRFEKGNIYYLDDQRDYIIYCGNDPDYKEITENTMKFVSYYNGLTLNNYNNWTKINQQVEEKLKVAEAEQTIANEILMAEYAKRDKARQKKIKLKKITLYAMIGILAFAAIYIILVAFKITTGRFAVSSFENELFSVSGVLIYGILRIAYALCKKVRVKRW
jgi:hypothetical protein